MLTRAGICFFFFFSRFHSLIWVNYGMGTEGSSGRLIGGSENGVLTLYSPEEILASGEAAVVGESFKHTGPVRALDFNPFQVIQSSSNRYWLQIGVLGFG